MLKKEYVEARARAPARSENATEICRYLRVKVVVGVDVTVCVIVVVGVVVVVGVTVVDGVIVVEGVMVWVGVRVVDGVTVVVGLIMTVLVVVLVLVTVVVGPASRQRQAVEANWPVNEDRTFKRLATAVADGEGTTCDIQKGGCAERSTMSIARLARRVVVTVTRSISARVTKGYHLAPTALTCASLCHCITICNDHS